jgi:hypothetical protein
LGKKTQTFFWKKNTNFFGGKNTNFFFEKNQTFLWQTRGRTRVQFIVQDGRREYCCEWFALILKEMN